jgi:hypothetical protein
MKSICLILCCFCILFYPDFVGAQINKPIEDGRSEAGGEAFEKFMEEVPKEVLYNIRFHGDSVIFSITSYNWFFKIFQDETLGISADIVSKDQFRCGKKEISQEDWNIGTLIPPVYSSMLKNRIVKQEDGSAEIYLGQLPWELRSKEIEGNLVIVKNNKVYYYTSLPSLEESQWELLDMGLYTDSLMRIERTHYGQDTTVKKLYFTQKKTMIIPYGKGKTEFSETDGARLLRTMNLDGYRVEKISVRAFSSVDGDLNANNEVQKKRADNIVNIIQNNQKDSIKIDVVTAENWVEFMQSIEKSPFSYLKNLSKAEIKKRLEKKALLDSLESRLSKQRKAVVTVYLIPQSEIDGINDERMLDSVNSSIKRRDIDKSVRILRAIFEKIADKKVPSDFIDKIEVPAEKEFTRLLNDMQVYKNMLGIQSDFDALAELKKIDNIAPGNGKIKYNICALQLHVWQYDEKFMNKDQFAAKIADLKNYGVPLSLVKRMLINYNIVLCEIYMKQENFDAKDRVLSEIKNNYINRDLSDLDLLAIGRYFCYYDQLDWANDIIMHRIDKLDVSEDLLFFYINLSCIRNVNFEESGNRNMVLNAININPKRFCRFFNSSQNGGISMQLLLESFWKKMYCANCN